MIARRPHAGATLLPRVQFPVEASQTTDPLQYERDEARLVTAAIENRVGALAQLSFGVSVECGRYELRQLFESCPVEQQAAVAQPFPTRHNGRRSRHAHDAMSTVIGVVDVSSSKLTQSLSNRW